MRHDRSRGCSISVVLCRISRSFRNLYNPLFQLLLPFCTHPYDVWHMLYDTWYLTLCTHSYGIWCYARTHVIYGVWYMMLCVHLHGIAMVYGTTVSASFPRLLFKLHICMYLCVYVCIHVRLYTCMCVCLYAYMYICMFVCIYISLSLVYLDSMY